MPLPGSIIQNPTFNPAVAVIVAISQANGAVIQTFSPHTFVIGQSVRIIIPPAMRATLAQPAFDYGMHEINDMLANVIFTSALLPNIFRTDIDTQFFQPFTLPASPSQFAQAVPVGENTFQLNGAVRNVLPSV